MNNIYLQAVEKYSAGFPTVLATITRTSGSTPGKPGSSALFGVSGLLSGTVGGGILEGRVQIIAQDIMSTGESGYYHFNMDREISHENEAICGGSAEVLVSFITPEHIHAMLEMKKSLMDRNPGVMITKVSGTQEGIIDVSRYWLAENVKKFVAGNVPEKIVSEAMKMVKKRNAFDYTAIDEQGENSAYFLEPLFPPYHLVIAGAGHIGKALAHFGRLLDFDVTVVDEREEYANSNNIPDAGHFIVGDIGKTINGLKKSPDTFIVIVTRGHKDDADALKACINSEAVYIGMIGSKNKVGLMKDAFIRNSWASKEAWDRIHSPVGLEIGSKTIQEIAVSIAAQLVLVRSNLR